jgi:hypothetical protein
LNVYIVEFSDQIEPYSPWAYSQTTVKADYFKWIDGRLNFYNSNPRKSEEGCYDIDPMHPFETPLELKDETVMSIRGDSVRRVWRKKSKEELREALKK